MSQEYLYVFSNPSMPGLVKVGKTRTSPKQRQGELHTTGVPTPFEVELTVSVRNCDHAERVAHGVLDEYRVSGNREFFKVEIRVAIQRILGAIGEYELVEFKHSHGVDAIDAEIRRRKQAEEEERNRKRLREERLRREAEQEERAEVDALDRRHAVLLGRLDKLGSRPVESSTSGFYLLRFLYWPIPLGWIVWLGTLQVFSSKSQEVGFACIFLVAVGFFVNMAAKDVESKYETENTPFREVDGEIHRVERRLRELGREPNLKMANVNASMSILSCQKCGQKLRVPTGKVLDIRCPKCQALFRRST